MIIILIKAGLSLNLSDLKRVGRPALLMSFLPALFELLAFVLLAPKLLGVSLIEAAVMGAELGAVPLSLRLPCGNIVLSVAVLSIIITAPLGALGMEWSYQKLLCHEPEQADRS